MMFEQPPRDHWVPDEASKQCMICECAFAPLVRRRHHCRRCGALVCGPCSRQQLAARDDATAHERCCDDCWTAHHERLLRQDERLVELEAASRLRQRFEKISSVVEDDESASLVRVFALDGSSTTLACDELMTASELARAAGARFRVSGDCGLWASRRGRLDSLDAVVGAELVSNVLARWRIGGLATQKLVLPVRPVVEDETTQYPERTTHYPHGSKVVGALETIVGCQPRDGDRWTGDSVRFGGSLAVMRGRELDNEYAPNARIYEPDGYPAFESFAVVQRRRPSRRTLLVRLGARPVPVAGDVAPRSKTSLDEIDLRVVTRVVVGDGAETIVIVISGGARVGLRARDAPEAARWRAELRVGMDTTAEVLRPSHKQILTEADDVVEALYAERGRFRTARAELEAVCATLSSLSGRAIALASSRVPPRGVACCFSSGGLNSNGACGNDDYSKAPHEQQSCTSSLFLRGLTCGSSVDCVLRNAESEDEELSHAIENEVLEAARGDTLAAAHSFSQACAATAAQASMLATAATAAAHEVDAALAAMAYGPEHTHLCGLPPQVQPRTDDDQHQERRSLTAAAESAFQQYSTSSTALVASWSATVCANKINDEVPPPTKRTITTSGFAADEKEKSPAPKKPTSILDFLVPVARELQPGGRDAADAVATKSSSAAPPDDHSSGSGSGGGVTTTATVARLASGHPFFEDTDHALCIVKAALKHDVAKLRGRSRIIAERRALCTLSPSPFCTRLLATFQDANLCYVVLDFGSRGDLSLLLAARGQLDAATTRFYLACLAHGLDHCHAHGVVHRDVRAENAVIGRDGYVRLANFGLAAKLDASRRNLRTFCGTHVAPECVADGSYDHRVDWWATGCVAFELTTGNHPFRPQGTGAAAFAAICDAASGKFLPATACALRDVFSKSAASLVTSLLSARDRRLSKVADLERHVEFATFNWPAFRARDPKFTTSLPPFVFPDDASANITPSDALSFYAGSIVCFTGDNAVFDGF
ncbi:hypothetical protein CTAYLR_006460 [Chrysophaeum taylorii]|uniref:Non-specific serine/threonine protein kinase n=1 Tax=Chrysophaeum taylorii TaxID=2483200 RepID=A0AAD7ULE4_9STRA|nr:hypothetical protein CTAYLR_006460 [Chrysophaeum taylorii]